MAKFCVHCGKEIADEAVVCVHCGCSAGKGNIQQSNILNELSNKVKINGIIWLVIGGIQILLGIYVNWVLLIVGALNIVTGVTDINYSKSVIENPIDIVKKYQPLAYPIIILVYNLIFGGVIGVVGSIYYLVAIRNFVISNESEFAQIEQSNIG